MKTCAFVLDYPKDQLEVYLFQSDGTEPESILRPIYDKMSEWFSKNGSDIFKHIIGPKLFIESELPDFEKRDDFRIPKNTMYVFTLSELPRILTWRPLDRTEDQIYNLTGDGPNKIVMVTRLPKN